MKNEEKIENVIGLVKDKEFIVKNKIYKFSEQELKEDFTWDDMQNKDGVGFLIFNGNYVIFPDEKIIFY